MSVRTEDITDRAGVPYARIAWRGDALFMLHVDGAVVGGSIGDPLFGEAHVVAAAPPVSERATVSLSGERLTTLSLVDWARPTEIPAIAQPGALPPGAGGAIMNVLALLAQRASVPTLRYAGPYPTHALWATLARSFTTAATEDAFVATFAERAARVAREPLPVDFTPAPHERVRFAGGHSELRAALERVVIDGVAFAPGAGTTRLVDDHAELWFGDALWSRIATLSSAGELLAGPHAPRAPSSIPGELPPALRAALAELCSDAVPAPLADAAREQVTTRSIVWADLGLRTARMRSDAIALHAALWETLAPHGMARVALGMVEALVPLVTQLAAQAYLEPLRR